MCREAGMKIWYTFWGPASLKFFWAHNSVVAISNNFRRWSWMSPERIEVLKIEKEVINYNPSHVGRKEFGELCPLTIMSSCLISTQPKSTFLEDHILDLSGCCPLKRLRVLENDQGLLTHVTSGTGSPTIFYEWKFKNWPIIQHMSANIFGDRASNLTKLFHVTYR